MHKCLKTSLLATALFAGAALSSVVHAEEPTPPLIPHDYYVGIGLFDDMTHLNAEAVTSVGNFVVRAGRFKQINRGIAANMSWRTPLHGDPHADDYYVGVFAGQVDGTYVGGAPIQRLGGGAEMGYHWLTDYLRAEITLGVGSAAPERNPWGKRLAAEPTLFLTFSLGLGL